MLLLTVGVLHVRVLLLVHLLLRLLLVVLLLGLLLTPGLVLLRLLPDGWGFLLHHGCQVLNDGDEVSLLSVPHLKVLHHHSVALPDITDALEHVLRNLLVEVDHGWSRRILHGEDELEGEVCHGSFENQVVGGLAVELETFGADGELLVDVHEVHHLLTDILTGQNLNYHKHSTYWYCP